MKVLDRYLTFDFLLIFLISLLVFTFVMCMGAVIRAIDLMARGVSGLLILQVFAYNIPFLLSFTIPISVLTAVLLQFGRLSYDGELTAMKACGLSIWHIASPIILLSIVLSLVCAWISGTVAPRCHEAQRRILHKLSIDEPIKLLEEGRFVHDFPGLIVYVGKKERRQVKDIVAYQLHPRGHVERILRARSGTVEADRDQHLLLINLVDVRSINPQNSEENLYGEEYPIRLDYSKLIERGPRKKDPTDMTYREQFHAVRNIREYYPNLQPQDLMRQRMQIVVESNTRLAFSAACFAYTLLGIPLGMRSRRRESAVGIGISLLLMFFFYFFVILAHSLVDKPNLRPDLIVWFPVLFAEGLGFYLTHRCN